MTRSRAAMNKTALLSALTTLHEKPLDLPQWGLSGVLLREFTARERQWAQEAVQAEANGGDIDQVLYRAMLMQRCLTDPDTGRPYADGRTDGSTGQAAIDPRTRTPIFTVEEVADLADARAILFGVLWDNLLELAALGPQAMFSGDREDVSAERDTGAGVEGAGDATGADEGQGSDGPDRREQVARRPKRQTGDGPGPDAKQPVE